MRRRVVVPSLHKRYVASMVNMFAECTEHGSKTLNRAHAAGEAVEMENYFSRLALDIIGKAVFNYDFDSLTHDDPVISVSAWRLHGCMAAWLHGGMGAWLHGGMWQMACTCCNV